jgi:hypothetical protein
LTDPFWQAAIDMSVSLWDALRASGTPITPHTLSEAVLTGRYLEWEEQVWTDDDAMAKYDSLYASLISRRQVSPNSYSYNKDWLREEKQWLREEMDKLKKQYYKPVRHSEFIGPGPRPPQRGVKQTPIPSEAKPITLGRDLDANQQLMVGQNDLCSGCYILGVQGVGKSTLLEQIANQQAAHGESIIVFDAHGDLVDDIIRRMPASRLNDAVVFDLRDNRTHPFGLNVFACKDPTDEEEVDATRNYIMHAFEKLWPETSSGLYFKQILRHVIATLIEQRGLTLRDIPKLLTESAFRQRYTSELANFQTQAFWERFNSLRPAAQERQTSPFLHRMDELMHDSLLPYLLCWQNTRNNMKKTLDLRAAIDNKQILLIKLPINDPSYRQTARTLGTLLMARIYAATFSFANVPKHKRPGFTLIVDEFQNFATDDFAVLFSQGRKFKVKQFLAHQYRDQLNESGMGGNRGATLSAQTKIICQTTPQDSRELASLFVDLDERRQAPNVAMEVLNKLDKHPHPAVQDFSCTVRPATTAAGRQY